MRLNPDFHLTMKVLNEIINDIKSHLCALKFYLTYTKNARIRKYTTG